MLRIIPVDFRNDLFRVERIIPRNIEIEILKIDWLSESWSKQESQETWARRKINRNYSIDMLHNWIISNINIFSTLTKLELKFVSTKMWLDEENFTVVPHTDTDKVHVALQIFWSLNDVNLGTKFYRQLTKIRYDFPYIINTGYLMINNPRQIHGMLNPVPKGTYRLSSYTAFTTGM